MKIQSIEITNYKAFLGTHTIKVCGKNLFIYGENGSGKSSLYYALKDFFQSSMEDIDLNELENVFVKSEEQGKTAIEVTFRSDEKGKKETYSWDKDHIDSRAENDTAIRDANTLKSFVTYKHLLGLHNLKKDDEINLFDLLVKGVLAHYKSPLTGNRDFLHLWSQIEIRVNRKRSIYYRIDRKSLELNYAIKMFNKAFGELFDPDSPEYLMKYAQPLLDYFDHNIELSMSFPQVRPANEYESLEGNVVNVAVKYAGKNIDKPHLFLNEARLSAIAISIYLGMIKRHPQLIPCKILFLDDIFIGLDIANRLPLLRILDEQFPDYQIFITTYDKPWFEHAKGFLDSKQWKCKEFYVQTHKDGTETPLILDDVDLLKTAENHLQHCDFKASAVYARSAFEQVIRQHCERTSKPVPYKSNSKKYTSEHFWRAIKGDLSESTKNNIEIYRSLVLNTFSHYNTERHEIKTELNDAINAIKNLKGELLNEIVKNKQTS